MNLAIVTPSYVNSPECVQLAQGALASLEKAVGTSFPHIVVDDIPRCSSIFGLRPPIRRFRHSITFTTLQVVSSRFPSLTWHAIVKAIRIKNITRIWRFMRNSAFETLGAIISWLPNLKLYSKAKVIYNRPNITLIRRFRRSSTSATLQAVREARKQGAQLILIHLDDSYYIPLLNTLIEYARDAFEHDKELMEVRLSGLPICSPFCKPELGNRTLLNITDAGVSLESVHLQPKRYKDYTLWWSYYNEDMVDGSYWPIAMWITLYRAEFLEKLLTYATVPKLRHLNQVEVYYKKNKDNWRRALRSFSGKLGYINMQFGGLDIEYNPNWQELLQMPNEPVR